jgi:2-polyprenyl-6-methoxyphenol hydroxylase-like FAD-dependent oxidoreductase
MHHRARCLRLFRWISRRAEFAGVPAPIQQPKLVRVLAERAGDYEADIRWGHVLTGFDQDANGVTVHVSGPDGGYQLRAKLPRRRRRRQQHDPQVGRHRFSRDVVV